MKIYPATFFVLCCALIGTTVFAQATTASPTPPPLPPGPLIQKRAPDPSQWVITIVSAPAGNRDSASGAAADGSATNGSQNAGDKQKMESEVTITKTGKIMLREVRTQDGRVVPTWCVGDLQITVFGGTSTVQAKLVNPDPTVPTPNYEDYSDSDFQGFDWIAIGNYTGIKELGGRKCIVFRDTAKNMSAYVDLTTRLPVELADGGSIRNYTFKGPPTSELVLPSNVVQLLKNRQRELDSATPRSQRQ